MMEQYRNQKPNASLSEPNERETEETPLSQNQIRLAEFSKNPNIKAINHVVQTQYSPQKRQPHFTTDIKLLCLVLGVIALMLIGVNIFIFEDPQVNNKTALFTSVNQNLGQQSLNQANYNDKQVQQLQKVDGIKKQYSPSSAIISNQINHDMQQTKIKNQQTQSKHQVLSFAEKMEKISAFKSDSQVQPNKVTNSKMFLTSKTPVHTKKRVNNLPTYTVKYKLYTQGPPQNKITTKQIQKEIKKVQTTQRQQNILSHITKNPYGLDKYAGINRQDLRRASKWRVLASEYYDVNCQTAREELQYYTKKYQIDKYEELAFCIVIPTVNNMARRRAQKNIKSVLMQNYTNYRVIIIDDGSVDKTGQYVQSFLRNQTILSEKNYKIVINKQRKYALPNVLYAANTFCNPKDIFIVLDGDDELLGKQVLKLFNSVFQKQKVWFMYTNFLTSSGTLGYSRPYPLQIMKKNTYRDYGFTVTHLRAYYTQLLLNIKDEDLRDQNNQYFTAAGDMAVVMPCLEQAHQRVKYVPELTYLYNWNTGQNVHGDRLTLQRRNNLKIRSKPRYSALQTLF